MSALIALCQDCLKVIEGAPEEIEAYHREDAFCMCGGQVCACPDCVCTAETIQAIGKRETILKYPHHFSAKCVAEASDEAR